MIEAETYSSERSVCLTFKDDVLRSFFQGRISGYRPTIITVI
jgi:hypothetical protein